MPKQNRITPIGEIVRSPARGTLMGNRGILHNEEQEIIRPYQIKRWIICILQFKNRQRQVMRPNRYTELFFLDEATALAAGHRPCFECQRERAKAFQAAWQQAFKLHNRPTVAEMDNQLHQERLTNERLLKDKRKQTFTAVLDELPDGVFVQMEKRPYLWWQQQLYPWTMSGYLAPINHRPSMTVSVLTPYATVAVIKQGFLPAIHFSLLK